MNHRFMSGTVETLGIEEAVQRMKEEIAAGEENLKRQQVKLALSVKMKGIGICVSDKGVSELANAIRIMAEVGTYGVERADQIEAMMVKPEDIRGYSER